MPPHCRLIAARIHTDDTGDLVGEIGRVVLDGLNPPRDQWYATRSVLSTPTVRSGSGSLDCGIMPASTGPALSAVLMFLLELGLLGAAGFWALTVFASPWAAVVAVVVVAAVWGLVLSPKAPARPRWPWHAVAGHVLFLLGAVVLFVVGQPLLGGIYLALIAVSTVLTVLYRGRLEQESQQAREERHEAADGAVRPTGRRVAGR